MDIFAFLSWIILTILPGLLDALFFRHFIAFLFWYLIAIGIFNPITVFIWDLVACSISFLLRSIFCYWSAVRGIKIFAGCWVIHPNLLSLDRLFPMLLATPLLSTSTFIFLIRHLDGSGMVVAFFSVFGGAFISPGIFTFLF